jgi:hypothetical protein
MAQAKTTTKKAAPKAAPKVVESAPVVEKVQQAPKDTWVSKDRLYELTNQKQPLVFTVPSRHTDQKPLLWFDEEEGYNRELRYATNQRSCFVDEQDGNSTLGRIVFRNGVLRVPKENVVLQKLLSLYHPFTKQNIIKEYAPEQIAQNDVNWIEAELEAMTLARDLDIEELEAIMRTEVGSEVSNMSSKELRRDGLMFARRNPGLFLELANDDNVHLRNIGVKATEMGIIVLSNDNRTFTYGESGRKLMTVPFDEHPYSALAAYFKTDEGMEVLNAIQKRL